MARPDFRQDAVVIGAGWAGLGVSHALQTKGIRHVVLDSGRIGETWRSQRWDSFHLNTANLHTVMPGDAYTGEDPDGAMPCHQFVALLEDFVRRHRLPVETFTPVIGLVKTGQEFEVRLADRAIRTGNVVLANGTQNLPYRPHLTHVLPPHLCQIDACDYRNAHSLPDGAILVVGSGQSGGQIAEDLIRSGRKVYLSTSKVGRQFRSYRGRHVMYWLVLSGLFDRTRAEMLAEGSIAARPLTGSRATISLQSLSAEGVVLLGRLTGCVGEYLHFSDEVPAHIRHADDFADQLRQKIDAYIARAGLAAPDPQPDPAEIVLPRWPDPPILALNAREAGVHVVIWCTGVRGDFRWTDVPGLLDDQGQPVQEANFARVPGIYIPGVPFSVTRLSGTIHSIADESARISTDIERRVRSTAAI